MLARYHRVFSLPTHHLFFVSSKLTKMGLESGRTERKKSPFPFVFRVGNICLYMAAAVLAICIYCTHGFCCSAAASNLKGNIWYWLCLKINIIVIYISYNCYHVSSSIIFLTLKYSWKQTHDIKWRHWGINILRSLYFLPFSSALNTLGNGMKLHLPG